MRNTKRVRFLTGLMILATSLTFAWPTTAMAATTGIKFGVAADGQVTMNWTCTTWPPVISGWTWVPPAGNFAFQTTTNEEKWFHTGDEFQYYSTSPSMIAPNSTDWIRYALDHNGGKTLPFSWKFVWTPLGNSAPGYGPSKIYESYATVTPQIAQLLAANGLTLEELQAGEPISAPSSKPATTVSAPAKTTTVTASTPAKTTTTVASAPAKTATTVASAPAKATLPAPPAKGDLSPASNPDSQTNKDIAAYNTNVAKVASQKAAQAKAQAQQKKIRVYELWAIAVLAVLLVVMLTLIVIRKRNMAKQE